MSFRLGCLVGISNSCKNPEDQAMGNINVANGIFSDTWHDLVLRKAKPAEDIATRNAPPRIKIRANQGFRTASAVEIMMRIGIVRPSATCVGVMVPDIFRFINIFPNPYLYI